MEPPAKQRILKIGGALLIIAGLGFVGWSILEESFIAGCDAGSNSQCYATSIFTELFGVLLLGAGAIGSVVSKSLPQFQENWSLSKEERRALWRMNRDDWTAYLTAKDLETKKKLLEAELKKEHETKPVDESQP